MQRLQKSSCKSWLTRIGATVVGSASVVGALGFVSTHSAQAQTTHNYAEALQKSLFFYEAQESGTLSPGNRVSWRGPAHLNDGADVSRNLSGGWYDAGDHWKSNTTMAYAASLLAWSAVRYPASYTDKGQMDELLNSLRHVNDYFLRCIVDPNSSSDTNFTGYEIYVDVGGNPGPSPSLHSVWTAPETTDIFTARQSVKVNTTITGPDVAAAMSAAMSSSAILFKNYGNTEQQTYANTLLTRARKLLAYSENYPFNAQSLVGGAPQAISPDGTVRTIDYRSGDARDEVLFANLWMHKASQVFAVSGYTNAYLNRARTIVDGIESGGTALWDYFGWWRDFYIAQYQHGVLMLWLQVTDNAADISRLEGHLHSHLEQWDNTTPTPGGLKVRQEYGGALSLKWALNQCYLAMMYSDFTTDTNRKTRYYNYAKSQMDYALGSNPLNMSFVIGYGATWSQSSHHRGSHGWWGGFESISNGHAFYKPTHRHILYGGLMGGPRSGKWVESPAGSGSWVFQRVDEYEPILSDHTMNEVALDFNAGMQGVLAGLIARNPSAHNPLTNFPVAETRNTSLDWMTTDRQYFVVANQSASSSTSVQISGFAHNQSAWPARVTRNLSFRYFFTLDAGMSASNISATLNNSQGGQIGPVTQWSGNVYYVQVTFPNNPILPNRIYQASSRPGAAGLPDDLFRRSFTFTLSTNAGTWDNSNDHSYSSMNGTSTIRPNIPVYDNGSLLEGSQPAQSTTPAAPGGLGATAISSSQINLTWTDNANNETGFKIERKIGATGSWVEIASNVAANSTSYSNGGLNSSTQYYYRVRAFNASGNSGYSNEANATTQVAGSGAGLKGEYFNNMTLTGSVVLTRTEAVNFGWGNSSPGTGVNADGFSVRWSGQVEAPVGGSYTFSTISDDGVRLWVNNNQVINNWTDHGPTTDTASAITLTAGQKVDIRMEFYENGGGAEARLRWSYPGQAATAIPASYLYPANGTVTLVDRTTNPGGGTITARGEHTSAGEGKEKAFDDSSSTKWLDLSSTTWIAYQFANSASYAVQKYTITSANDFAERDPKSWNLQGWNGSSWVNLDTRTNETFSARFQKKEYTFTNSTNYNSYRLNITANNGATITQLAEIELFSP